MASPQSKKNLLFILIGLAVLLGGGGYFAVTYLERQMVNAVQTEINTLPGRFEAGSVQANFFNHSLHFSDVSYSSPDEWAELAPLKITAKSLEIQGIGKLQEDIPGPQKLASRIVFQDLLISSFTPADESIGIPAITSTIFYGENIISDLSADYQAGIALRKALQENPKISAEELLKIPSLLPTLLSLSYAGEATDICVNFDGAVSMTLKVKSSSFGESTLLHTENCQLQDISASFNQDQGSFSAKSLSLKAADLPDVLTLSSQGPEAMTGARLFELFQKQAFQLDQLIMKDAALQIPGQKPLQLQELRFDLRLHPEDSLLDVQLENLVLQPEMMDLAIPHFATLHNKPLQLNALHKIHMQKSEQADSMRINNTVTFKEPSLGDLSYSTEMSMPPITLDSDPLMIWNAVFLNRVTCDFDNNGIVDLISKCYAAQIAGESTAAQLESLSQAFKNNAIESLKALRTPDLPESNKLVEDISRAIREKGRLHINYTPAPPISLSDPQWSTGLESSFSPFEQ